MDCPAGDEIVDSAYPIQDIKDLWVLILRPINFRPDSILPQQERDLAVVRWHVHLFKQALEIQHLTATAA